MTASTPSASTCKLTIKKAAIDLSSVKTQMILGLAAVFCACLFAYWPALSAGFLLDDFLHLDYVARAAGGDAHDFLSNLWSNWAGSDIMKSYRPVVSLSLFIDYLLWRTNALGFHLGNILAFFGCCTLVSLITLEITGLSGNRLGAAPAVWSGLLFAAYPLHPEAVAWVIGRVDVLCALFYLGSLFMYMRFRLLRERAYLAASLVLFVLALGSKEMAATLPLVIAVLEACLYSRAALDRSHPLAAAELRRRSLYIGSYFVVLAVFAVARFLILGRMVGGYASAVAYSWDSALAAFADKPTFLKILFPIHEEVPLQIGAWPVSFALARSFLTTAYTGLLVVLFARAVTAAVRPGAFLGMLLLIPVMVLPAFQIWHIYPNLVGSRLFFLASAPLCILIALAALPAIDVVRSSQAKLLSLAGALVLASIFVLWWALLKANLSPWQTAGRLMSSLSAQVLSIAAGTAAGKRALLLDLPTDFSGAGMLTRPKYLEILLRRPFSNEDLSTRVLTIEPPISGSHEFMWPRQLSALISHPDVISVYRWDRSKGRFERWHRGQGKANFKFQANGTTASQLRLEPESAIVADGESWHVMSESQPALVKFGDRLRIYPGTQGLTVWFPAVALDPLEARVIDCDLTVTAGSAHSLRAGARIKVLWSKQPSQAALSGHTDGQEESAALSTTAITRRVWIGRYRSWSLNGTVERIGLKFEPGDYFAELRELSVVPDTEMVPTLRIAAPGKASDLWLKLAPGNMPLSLDFDLSRIPSASRSRLLITASGTTFDASCPADTDVLMPQGLPSPQVDLKIGRTVSRIAVPTEVLRSPGVHQARVIALDAADRPVGLPSEPVSFAISDNDQTRAPLH